MKAEHVEPLDNLILSYSCPINWDSMDGNERERFCKQCSKTVFNISDLSKKEANAYLDKRANASHCVKFYLRSDGTITTDECPKILRPVRNTARFLARTVAGLISVLFCFASSLIPLQAKNDDESENKSATSIFKNKIKIDLRHKIMVGQTCPSEVGDLRRLLFNLVPENDTERILLEKIPKDAISTKQLDLTSIQELMNNYKVAKKADRYFLAKLLETYILLDNPNNTLTELELKQLEELHLKATDFIVNEAEKCLKDGNKDEANSLAIYSLRLGECGGRIPYRDLYYPIKNARWRLSPKHTASMNIVMRQNTLKKLLIVLTKLEPDSLLSDPDVEKLENPVTNEVSEIAKKMPTEEPKPEFYKKELLDSPIAVIANLEQKRFTDKAVDSFALRHDCFVVTKVLKAPEETKAILQKSKILRGKYSLPFSTTPTPFSAIGRYSKQNEVILFIKSVYFRDIEPPYLHCEIVRTIYRTDELETKFEKWISNK